MQAHRLEHPVRGHDIVLHCRVRIDSALSDIRVGGKVEKPVRPFDMLLPAIAQQVCLDKPDLTAINMPGQSFRGALHRGSR